MYLYLIIMDVGRSFVHTILTTRTRNLQRTFSYFPSIVQRVTSKGFHSICLQNERFWKFSHSWPRDAIIVLWTYTDCNTDSPCPSFVTYLLLGKKVTILKQPKLFNAIVGECCYLFSGRFYPLTKRAEAPTRRVVHFETIHSQRTMV